MRQRGSKLMFPYAALDGSTFERTRSLNGSGPTKVRQPPGVPLVAWWPRGRPSEPPEAAFVAEGETDALAALSAVREAPAVAGLDGLAVIAVPGASYPAKRLGEELVAVGSPRTYLAADADKAGREFAERAVSALREAGVPALRIELPDGSDVADLLAAADDPGDALANLLADAQAAAEGPARPRRSQVRPGHRAAARGDGAVEPGRRG